MATSLGWEIPSPQLLTATFSKPLAKAIYDQGKRIDKSEMSLGKLVLQQAAQFVPSGISLANTYPQDTGHFFQTLDKVMSDNAKIQIRNNIVKFNDHVRAPLSHVFLRHRTFSNWLLHLVDALMHCQKAARLGTVILPSAPSTVPPSVPSSAPWSASSTISSRSSAPSKCSPDIDKSYDGASHAPPPNKIVQVELTGPTLLTAWGNNTTIVDSGLPPLYEKTQLRDLEKICPGRDASPGEGNYSTLVFHGTDSHFAFPDWPNYWNYDTPSLTGSGGGGQMNPRGVKVAYTAFSPRRAFLWAVFSASLYESVPTANKQNDLRREFSSKGKTYKGVAVLTFRINLPTNDLPSHILPNAAATQQFADKVLHMKTGPAGSPEWELDEAWAHLQPSHNSTLKKWPDVLHSHEYGPQQTQLTKLNANLFRTCWSGKGIEKLNSCYTLTMAITFTYIPAPSKPLATPPVKAPPKKDDGKDKEKDKDHKCKCSLRAGFLNAVKKVASKSSLLKK